MGLLLSSKDNLCTITPLGLSVKAISTLPIPITARGIKSFIGCVIYLAQFLPINPINDILRKCNKVKLCEKISLLPTNAIDKGKGKNVLLTFRNIGCQFIPIHTTNFEAIKELIVQTPVLHLPAISSHFYLECDSSIKHTG